MKETRSFGERISDWWNCRCEFSRTCDIGEKCSKHDPEYFDGIGTKAYCGKFRSLKYGVD